MSVISTIYDNFNTAVAALFPTKTELENSYDIADNPDVLLKNGYGITWDAGTYLDDLNGPIYYQERSVSVVLTAKIFRTDLDRTARRAVEKALLESSKLIVDAIKSDPTVYRIVEYFESAGDSGMGFVQDEKQNIISIKNNFTLRYAETL